MISGRNWRNLKITSSKWSLRCASLRTLIMKYFQLLILKEFLTLWPLSIQSWHFTYWQTIRFILFPTKIKRYAKDARWRVQWYRTFTKFLQEVPYWMRDENSCTRKLNKYECMQIYIFHNGWLREDLGNLSTYACSGFRFRKICWFRV